MTQRANPSQRGFTLLEILIVVILLGILTTIVVAQMDSLIEDTEKAAFVGSIKAIAGHAHVYYLTTGNYLEDSSSGQLPAGFGPYISRKDWEKPTPIGGVWDAEGAGDFPGVVSAVGVHFNSDAKDDAYMADIDAILDDGNLSTGAFRKIGGGRFYLLVAAE